MNCIYVYMYIYIIFKLYLKSIQILKITKHSEKLLTEHSASFVSFMLAKHNYTIYFLSDFVHFTRCDNLLKRLNITYL